MIATLKRAGHSFMYLFKIISSLDLKILILGVVHSVYIISCTPAENYTFLCLFFDKWGRNSLHIYIIFSFKQSFFKAVKV